MSEGDKHATRSAPNAAPDLASMPPLQSPPTAASSEIAAFAARRPRSPAPIMKNSRPTCGRSRHMHAGT